VYWIVKFIQSLAKALNSEGTPAQVAAGIAFGSCLGLTPLISLHNLLIVGVILFFRVSVPGATLGWLIFTPVGFMLDPLFDSIGTALIVGTPALESLWITLYNTPVIALGNPTNTIVVGSFTGWVVGVVPIYVVARVGVGWYRRTIYERYKDAKVFKALRASKLYSVYRLFRPRMS
jgi:uncharacterized protein (TIGR03546 family)